MQANDQNHPTQPQRGNLPKSTTGHDAEQVQSCSNALVAVGCIFWLGDFQDLLFLSLASNYGLKSLSDITALIGINTKTIAMNELIVATSAKL